MFIGQEVNLVELINHAFSAPEKELVLKGHHDLNNRDSKKDLYLTSVLQDLIKVTGDLQSTPDAAHPTCIVIDASQVVKVDDYHKTLSFIGLGVVVERGDGERWSVIEVSDNVSDPKYYKSMDIKSPPAKIRLNISETESYDLDDIDDVYKSYLGINVYTDKDGFYTTPSQLCSVKLMDLYRFLHKTGLTEHNLEDVAISDVLIAMEILKVIGVLYNAELFKLVHSAVEELSKTKLAIEYQTSFVNKKMYAGTKRKFIIIPKLGNVAVSVGIKSSPITFVNLDTSESYNLFYLE